MPRFEVMIPFNAVISRVGYIEVDAANEDAAIELVRNDPALVEQAQIVFEDENTYESTRLDELDWEVEYERRYWDVNEYEEDEEEVQDEDGETDASDWLDENESLTKLLRRK